MIMCVCTRVDVRWGVGSVYSRSTVMGMLGELGAVSDLVAEAAAVVVVVAQQVVDLLVGPLLQLAGHDAGVGGHEGDEGGVT